MSIRDLLLSRLGKRKAKSAQVVFLPSRPVSEKISALQEMVIGSIIPRKIFVTGGGMTLVLTAANRQLLAFEVDMDGQPGTSHDFGAANAAAVAGLRGELAAFFTKAGECRVDFTTLDADFAAEDGVSPDILGQETASKPRLVLRSKPTGAARPAEFLAVVDSDIVDARYWPKSGEWPKGHANPLASEARPGQFSGMEALHAALSPSLGNELLFVATTGGTAPAAYVVAQDDRLGMVGQLNPQKLGRVCNIWRKINAG